VTDPETRLSEAAKQCEIAADEREHTDHYAYDA